MIYSYAETKPKNRLYVLNDKTYFKPLNSRNEDENVNKLFVECVLKFVGYLEDSSDSNRGKKYCVCSCRGLSQDLTIVTK